MSDQSQRDASLWSCGSLGKLHGLAGELYLNLAPDGLERLVAGERFYVAAAGADELRPCVVTRCGGTDRRPLVCLDLAPDRESARALQGRELLAAGGELDARPNYRVGDLLGLPVRTASGRFVGEVGEVLESPAHEILSLRAPDGHSILIPLVEALVAPSPSGDALIVVDGLLEDS